MQPCRLNSTSAGLRSCGLWVTVRVRPQRSTASAVLMPPQMTFRALSDSTRAPCRSTEQRTTVRARRRRSTTSAAYMTTCETPPERSTITDGRWPSRERLANPGPRRYRSRTSASSTTAQARHLSHSLQAIEVRERIRTAARLEEFKTRLAAQTSDVYERAIELQQ